MILTIYLIGAAIAFALLLIYSIINLKKGDWDWPTLIIFFALMTQLSWFTVFLVIITLKPAYLASKARKAAEKRTPQYIYMQREKDKACLKAIRGGNFLSQENHQNLKDRRIVFRKI